MAVTTGTQAEATPEPEVKAQPDVPVEPVAGATLTTSMTAIDSEAFRTGIKAMTAALGSAERFLPDIPTAHGERYAQVGDVRNDGTATGDSPVEPSDQQRKELKDKYGVDVELKDGKYSFTREINGQKREVFSSDATTGGMEIATNALEKQDQFFKKYGVSTFLENGKMRFTHVFDQQVRDSIAPIENTPDALDKADKNLEAQTQSKIKELENRFKITIVPSGQEVGNQEDLCRPKGETAGLPRIRTRTPTLGELNALEKALSQSEPSQLHLPGEKPLAVMFLDTAAAVDRDGNDIVRGVYFPPEVNNGQGVLAITPSGVDAPLGDKDVLGDEESLASTIRHEIAHNGQRNLFPRMEVPDSLLKEMGWIKFPNPDYKPNQPGSPRFNYAIGTKDGRYYVNSGFSCDGGEGKWLRVDKNGKYLDSDGKQVQRKEDAGTIDNDDLAREAIITPATGYFSQPIEVLAEGMKQFRGGKDSREDLQANPELFKIIEKVDELERKLRYGVDRNGRAKVQRREDGTLDR